jgi:hypothetical protein
MSLYIQLQDTEWEITEKLTRTEPKEIQYLSRRIFCFEVFVAGFIQDLLLIRTNRYSSIHSSRLWRARYSVSSSGRGYFSLFY